MLICLMCLEVPQIGFHVLGRELETQGALEKEIRQLCLVCALKLSTN